MLLGMLLFVSSPAKQRGPPSWGAFAPHSSLKIFVSGHQA